MVGGCRGTREPGVLLFLALEAAEGEEAPPGLESKERCFQPGAPASTPCTPYPQLSGPRLRRAEGLAYCCLSSCCL